MYKVSIVAFLSWYLGDMFPLYFGVGSRTSLGNRIVLEGFVRDRGVVDDELCVVCESGLEIGVEIGFLSKWYHESGEVGFDP